MRKLLFLLTAVLCVSYAQAIAIYWTAGANTTSGWSNALGTSTVEAVYFIYSASEVQLTTITGDSIYSTVTSGTSSSVTYASSTGGSTGSNWSYNLSGDYAAEFGSLTSSNTSSGYFYMVLQTTDSTTGITTYHVSTVEYYSTTADGTSSRQDIVNDTVDPDTGVPDAGQYVEVSYGKSVSAPEPTTLALLALGVAGLALRRRVK